MTAEQNPVEKSKATRWPILAVILLFALFSFFYLRNVPPFEGPDEPQHFAYVTWLAEGKSFPPQGEGAWFTPVQQEAGQPPLYYFLASLPVRLINFESPKAEFRPNPHFPSSAPGHIPDNKNIAIHYPEDEGLQGGWLALRLARGVSFLFGVLLIISVYMLARELFPDSFFIPIVAASMTAVIPQLLFISNVVSNDIAAAATGALSLWLLARLVHRGPSWKLGMAFGIAFGLSALSKTGNLALGLPATAVFIWLWWRFKGERGQVFGGALAAAGSAILVGGWWYFRSWYFYGTPFGLEAHYLAPWALTADSIPPNALAQWTEVFYSFWAAFGWGNIKFPAWVYYSLFLLAGLAVIGLFLRFWWDRKNDRQLRLWFWLPLLALAAVALSLTYWMQQVTAPHGRLLFPALAAVTVLMAAGLNQLSRRLVYSALSFLLALNFLSLVLLILPAYAQPEFLESFPFVEQELDWRFGDFAVLSSVTPLESSVAAGGVLPVSVCWQTLGAASEDYTIMVQLVGPENQVVGGRRTYPGLGSYPTSTWQAGKRFCDEIRVDIPADLPRTLQYQIEVGLLDELEQRLTAFNSDGRPRDHLFAAAARLESAESAQFDHLMTGSDPIRLTEADFNPAWPVGTIQTVTLRWWLAEPVNKDYTVFVHLRDMEQGNNVGQGDGPPVDGWYPTSLWKNGEVVEDIHEVLVTADIAPGSYDLVVGWYDPASNNRLGSEIPLGTVEVVP